MNLKNFLLNFTHLANASNGVNSLRQLVMASALTGKLSPPNSRLATDIKIRIEEARSEYFSALKKPKKPLIFAAPLIHEFVIPEGWLWVRVGEICLLQTGATPSTQRSDYWGGEIRWLASGDINRTEILDCKGRITEAGLANSNCKILPKDSVLIALNGQGKTRATVALLRIPAACNQSLIALTPFDTEIISPDYLFLSLRYRYHEIRDITGEDQRRGLNMALVSGLSVPLPPLAEQKRIVAKVSELMSLCDQLERQAAARQNQFPLLSQTCHTRFVEEPNLANLNRIFVETGTVSTSDLQKTVLTLAVEGKLTTQDPNDESVDLLLKRLRTEREMYARETGFKTARLDSIDKTSAFLIPLTWQWSKLSSLCNAVTDGDHLPPPKSSDGIAFLTIGNVTTGKLNFNNCRFVPKTYFEKLAPFRRPSPGDILYTVVGATYGRPALVEGDRKFCVQRHIAILKVCPSLDVNFLMILLQSPFVYAQATNSITGTAQPTVPLMALRDFLLPLPPLPEQRRIVTKVKTLLGLIHDLAVLHRERDKFAAAFTTASIAAFTGNAQPEKQPKMKAPKNELVSSVNIRKNPASNAYAPLARLLIKNNGTLSAKSLWQQSSLTIDVFYQQLKLEISKGWISPPIEAEMKIREES